MKRKKNRREDKKKMVDNYQMYINIHKDKHRNQRLWQTTVQILDWITRSTKSYPWQPETIEDTGLDHKIMKRS